MLTSSSPVTAEPFHIMARKRLLDLGLRQRDLAERAGVKPSALSKILNGGSPSWESALAIMAALDFRIVPASEVRQ